MKKWTGLLVLAIGLTGCGGNSDNRNADPAINTVPVSTETMQAPKTARLDLKGLSPAFGFADGEGKRIIAIENGQEIDRERTEEEIAVAESYNTAIGNNGQVLSIQFSKRQSRGKQDNGRQSAHNFNHLEGDVYEVVGEGAKPNESYYLVNNDLFNIEALIKLDQSEVKDVPAELSEAIAKQKKRKVVQGWQLASTEKGQQILLVQFERIGEQMLASLVLYGDGKMAFMDYPAVFNEASTWRVDDGGAVSPGMFSFLFAARSFDGIVLGVKWIGAEGETLSILKQSGDRLSDMNIHGSRYLSPT